MIEYKDGSASEVGEVDEMLDQFVDELDEKEDRVPAALHVGSEEELKAKKEKRGVEERLDSLEEKVDKMQSPRGTFGVAAPSPEEVRMFSNPETPQ